MAETMRAEAAAIMPPSSTNSPDQPTFSTILLVNALIAITPQLATPLADAERLYEAVHLHERTAPNLSQTWGAHITLTLLHKSP